MAGIPTDDPVLDQQVRGVDIGLDLQVVPVDDVVGEGSAAPLIAAGGGDMVEHPESKILDIDLPRFQKVAEVLVRLVRVFLEAEDTGNVVEDRFFPRPGFQDQVQLPILQRKTAYGDALLVKEAFQGEAR